MGMDSNAEKKILSSDWSKLFEKKNVNIHKDKEYPQSDINKIKAYFEAGRIDEINMAINGKCTFQTIKNIVNSKEKASNATIVKNGILRQISNNLPDLKFEFEYKSYIAMLDSVGAEGCSVDTRDKLIGRYSIIFDYNSSIVGNIKFGGLHVIRVDNPFFPVFLCNTYIGGKPIRHDGFILESKKNIILLGSSYGLVTISVLRKENMKNVNEVNKYEGNITIYNVINDEYHARSVCITQK